MNSFRLSRLVLAIASFLLPFAASAAGISISPLKFDLTVDAGKEASGIVKVTNNTGNPITLYSSKEDFVASGDSGTPSFVKPQERASDSFGLSEWVSIEDKNVTLAQSETREIRFTVKVPKNGEPGGHYGAIFFSPSAPSGSQVALVQRLGVLLLVNVPGSVKVDGGLDGFSIGKVDQDKKFKESDEFDSLPISFDIKFKNDGNIHLKPTGKVELVDENGNILKNVGKETVTNPEGVYVGEKMVDYLPINGELGSVLPKSERKFDYQWEGFGYPVLNPDGTKSVKFKNLTEYYADQAAEKRRYLAFYESVHTRSVTKKITANLSLSYDAPNKDHKEFRDSKTFEVTYDEDYVGVNYFVVAGALGLILLVAFYFTVIVPKSKEHLRKQLMEEMSRR